MSAEPEAELRRLRDRSDIQDVVVRFASALDMQDWAVCRSCFADDVEQDYSDFRGEPPSTMSADDFVARRREALSDIKTQHLSANHIITVAGDSAQCVSAFVIYRHKVTDGVADDYNTHGYYTHGLRRTADGWKIVKVQQSVLWSAGNPRVHGFYRQKHS